MLLCVLLLFYSCSWGSSDLERLNDPAQAPKLVSGRVGIRSQLRHPNHHAPELRNLPGSLKWACYIFESKPCGMQDHRWVLKCVCPILSHVLCGCEREEEEVGLQEQEMEESWKVPGTVRGFGVLDDWHGIVPPKHGAGLVLEDRTANTQQWGIHWVLLPIMPLSFFFFNHLKKNFF